MQSHDVDCLVVGWLLVGCCRVKMPHASKCCTKNAGRKKRSLENGDVAEQFGFLLVWDLYLSKTDESLATNTVKAITNKTNAS